VRRMRSW